MRNSNYSDDYVLNSNDFKDKLLRYFSFWPIFLISTIFSISIAFLYLRYSEYKFGSTAKIEIIDKAQDSEMALPTAMTIFNRSMINLENEIGVLTSFSLHKKVVTKIKSNILYYSVGTIKTKQIHEEDLFNDYSISYNIDTDNVENFMFFDIEVRDNELYIDQFDMNYELVESYYFKGLSTKIKNNKLPFDLSIFEQDLDVKRKITIAPVSEIVFDIINNMSIEQTGKESDQLLLRYTHPNKRVLDEYLNALIYEFDLDGINDRQLEYKRTMDFVDQRSVLLKNELIIIEDRKQSFKESNNLSDIGTDLERNIFQQFKYDEELFTAESQLLLLDMLRINLNEKPLSLMPVNIGIENPNINQLIENYNLVIKERQRFMISAGSNNSFVKTLETQLFDIQNNIIRSLDNYENSLKAIVANLSAKENEFSTVSESVPMNEKILRSIERELEIKESLFLLLLQKKEEASINYAVVSPSIKVVDYALGSPNPIFPNKPITYFIALMLGVLFPFTFFYLRFEFDTNIHTRDDVTSLLPNIPIIGEIPYIKDNNLTTKIPSKDSRNPLTESFRMVLSNLKFALFSDKSKSNGGTTILVTSSIKSEGKTLVSVNIANILGVDNNKVILIGSDLRNPQIHKFLEGVDKSHVGISNYIYDNKDNYKSYIIKNENMDLFLSGAIPPNPAELIGSEKFKDLINSLKNDYDYVIIDSAPTLLVADTYSLTDLIDSTVYVLRSGHTKKDIIPYIRDNQSKLPNLSLLINSMGNSGSYGYKYGYRYTYNYGYGYGYSEES